MVITVRVQITGLQELLNSVSIARSQLPLIKREINGELVNTFVKGARDKVHKVTRKTEASTVVREISEQKGVAESRWGAFYEERRRGTKYGTAHNFITQQLNEMIPQIDGIVNNKLNRLFGV